MRLMNFSDVHPDWTVVQSLTPVQVRATLELLITAMLLDGRISVSERETLIDEFSRLPVRSSDLSGGDVKAMVRECETRMRMMDADDFGDYLDSVCDEISPRNRRIAVLQLVTILAVSDGFSEDEFDLCRAIGHRFELESELIERTLRATWEARQACLRARSDRAKVVGGLYNEREGYRGSVLDEEVTGEYSR